MITQRSIDSDGETTLRDVIVHMVHMEQRLSARIDANTASIQVLTVHVDTLTKRMDIFEKVFTERMNALEEDLTATMRDTIVIRGHVGMPIPNGE